ncbi:MAG: tetratricopeptide repeat protein, partial [Candidatus Omnitrophica bacterium]|nr:tetratricopeptide repeat protein [Candidatus Omnitrophota bacterium]
MKSIFFRRKIYIFLVTIIIALSCGLSSFSEETGKTTPLETIRQYRSILETATDPTEIANAHYSIGYALEELGRETEATAEYLKIIINYPDAYVANKKAEQRLSKLYSGFSEKSKELIGKSGELGGQKNPTIFFAYIKSLYENYRNLGQYDKALNVLEKLYDMDPQNTSYLIDMGEIYLYAYTDIDKAMFHFNKAIEMEPNNQKAYVDIGRAFEKKGDYENAIKAYAKAADISPASPWAIYGLRRADGIRMAKDRMLIKDWYFIGPFDNSDEKGLERPFSPEENVDTSASYKGKGDASVSWFRPFGYDSSGYVDLDLLFKPSDYMTVYALTYVYSPRKRQVQLRIGSETGIKVWLNDKEVFYQNISKPATVDSDVATGELKEGWNKILVKVSSTWGLCGYYFRVSDLKSNQFEDLIFDPLKNDTRVKNIYRKFVREKRFRLTRIATVYTIAVSILLLGLYFMISNIYYKIKINRMKEDFISSVSHELKTPISAIKMLTETLKRGKVKQEQRKEQYYDMIVRESDRLTRFINKILDFAKLEKRGRIFYFESTDVTELAKTAIDIFRDEIQDPKLALNLVAGKEHILADIDKDAILQVIFNLVDNAYKYSKEEKDITVEVSDNRENAYIKIIDKGLGMPKGDIERIFDKFYRIERDIIKGTKGSGLGLAFVKSIIDA